MKEHILGTWLLSAAAGFGGAWISTRLIMSPIVCWTIVDAYSVYTKEPKWQRFKQDFKEFYLPASPWDITAGSISLALFVAGMVLRTMG